MSIDYLKSLLVKICGYGALSIFHNLLEYFVLENFLWSIFPNLNSIVAAVVVGSVGNPASRGFSIEPTAFLTLGKSAVPTDSDEEPTYHFLNITNTAVIIIRNPTI